MAAGQIRASYEGGSGLLYLKIKEALKDKITSLKANDRLPARGELMEEFGVTRTTVDRAVSELIGEGLLYARDGSGTFVMGRGEESKSRVGSWAVVIPDIMQDTYPGILRGVEDVAEAKGVSVLVCNTNNDAEKQDSYIRKLLDSDLSGVVIVPAMHGSIDLKPFRLMQAKGTRIVFCNRDIPGIEAPMVSSNNFYGGYLATKHLIGGGYKKIAYVSRPLYSTSIERYQGYLGALSEAGRALDERIVVFEDSYAIERPGYEISTKLLASASGIDAFFCFNDVTAKGCYEAVADLGLRPGTDIGIVGYDNTNICGFFPVKMSSVMFKTYEIGNKAAQVLLDMLSGVDIGPSARYIFQPELVVRESSVRR